MGVKRNKGRVGRWATVDLYRLPLALAFPETFPFVLAGGLAGALPFGGAFFFGRASESSESLPFVFFASCIFLSAANDRHHG